MTELSSDYNYEKTSNLVAKYLSETVYEAIHCETGKIVYWHEIFTVFDTNIFEELNKTVQDKNYTPECLTAWNIISGDIVKRLTYYIISEYPSQILKRI